MDWQGQYEKTVYHSLKEPPELPLSAEEKVVFEGQIKRLQPLTAKEVIDLSHDDTWGMYKNGEEIEMAAVLVAYSREPTAEDLAWVMSKC